MGKYLGDFHHPPHTPHTRSMQTVVSNYLESCELTLMAFTEAPFLMSSEAILYSFAVTAMKRGLVQS